MATEGRIPRLVLEAQRAPSPTLVVNELFLTVQGEGRWLGAPTVFVRTTGCHLRCSWCDSPHAFQEGEARRVEDVVREVEAHGARHVCVTGGEPLLQRAAVDLVRRLAEGGRTVVVETSGSLDVAPCNAWPAAVRANVCLSVDVKCPGSGEARSWREANWAALRPQDQVKFVVVDAADVDFALDFLRARPAPPCPVFVNPEGGVDARRLAALAEAVKGARLPSHDLRLGLQLHKVIWGDRRGV